MDLDMAREYLDIIDDLLISSPVLDKDDRYRLEELITAVRRELDG